MLSNKIKIEKKSFFVDITIYSFIIIFFLNMILSYNYSAYNLFVIITFFVIGLFSIYKIIFSKYNITINRNFYIFIFFFFFIAPLNQYTSNIILWRSNGMSYIYNDKDYMLANTMIIISLLFFEIGYNTVNKNKIKINFKIKDNILKEDKIKFNNKSLSIVLFINIISFLFLILTNNITKNQANGNALYIQVIHICEYIPISSLLLYSLNKEKPQKWFIIPVLIQAFIIFFPLLGAIPRFLIFGTYLSFIARYFKKTKYKSIYFLIFVVGFCFIFSSFNFFKFNNNISDFNLISNINFNSEDFDAYQMFMLTIAYVRKNNIVFGKNLLTALLCIIPRSIWNGKLESSGGIAIDYFNSWFTNVSCPFIAEFYFSFGIIGIIILSYLFGKLIKKIDSFSESKNYFKQSTFFISCGLLIYILRGALLPTWSYTFGLMLSLLIVYLLFIKIR